MNINKYFQSLDSYQGYKSIKLYGVNKKNNYTEKLHELNKPISLCGIHKEQDVFRNS